MTKITMNVFQILAVASALFVSWASAQGHMRSPQPIQGDVDSVGYNNVDGCGLAAGQEFKYLVAQQTPTLSVYPGQTMSVSYVANGPLGFGPIYVRFDSAGLGTKYDYMATMNSNIAGVNGYLQQSPSGYFPYQSNVTFTVPQDIKCTKNGMCLMQVLNQQAYVSCTYVKLVAAPLPPTDNSGLSLYGGSLMQAKILRLEALVEILKNLGVDARVLYQANFDVADLIKRLTAVIN